QFLQRLRLAALDLRAVDHVHRGQRLGGIGGGARARHHHVGQAGGRLLRRGVLRGGGPGQGEQQRERQQRGAHAAQGRGVGVRVRGGPVLRHHGVSSAHTRARRKGKEPQRGEAGRKRAGGSERAGF